MQLLLSGREELHDHGALGHGRLAPEQSIQVAVQHLHAPNRAAGTFLLATPGTLWTGDMGLNVSRRMTINKQYNVKKCKNKIKIKNQADKKLTSKFGDDSTVLPKRVQVWKPLLQQPLNRK